MTIQLLFFIGLATSLLKGIDLFFSKEDKRKIQVFFEDFVLRVDDLESERFSIVVTGTVLRAVVTYITYILGVIFLVTVFLIKEKADWFTELIIYFLIYFVVVLFISNKLIISPILGFINNEKSVLSIIIKFLFVFLVIIIMWVCSVLYLVNWRMDYFNKLMTIPLDQRLKFIEYFDWFIIFGFPCFVIFNSLMYGVIFLISLRLSITRKIVSYLLIFFRKAIWRITTYEKGVVAGLSIVITLILGVIELVLKSYK